MADVLAQAAAQLARAGVPSARWDAELLLRHVLHWDRARLVAEDRQALPARPRRRLEALVARRARREPLQYLLGVQAFWRHEFAVTPAVLVPRPESEILVEEALRRLREVPAPRLADVGTGSGCLALSLAAERPDARVHAVDLSAAALAVARRNARRLGLAGRVTFACGDLLQPLVRWHGSFDAVLSNPPYVDRRRRATLAPEVARYEPALALYSGRGGYALYERLAPQAAAALRPGGLLLVELGQGMAAGVSARLAAAGFELVGTRPDLAGIERVLIARRPV